jgi:GR25 family glycosyltransferase involved in LPS biosynthesis
MNIFVINLKHRVDRLQYIKNQLKDYQYTIIDAVDGYHLEDQEYNIFKNWIDPTTGRFGLTNGEIGCALSHIKAWKEVVKLNKPSIILEDDTLLRQKIDFNLINEHINESGFLYLYHREMQPEKSKSVDYFKNIPAYPYMANAYILTPIFAKKLLDYNLQNNLIPVDEFFPLLNGMNYETDYIHDAEACYSKQVFCNFKKLNKLFNKDLKEKFYALRLKENFRPARNTFSSDIECSYSNENLLSVVTAYDDESKASMLIKSCNVNKIKIKNLCEGIPWNGGSMKSTGGGQKVNLLYDHLLELKKQDKGNFIVLFVDGFDVIINDTEKELLQKFNDMKVNIVFAAEKNCWPDQSLAKYFESYGNDNRFLNSGCIIGYVDSLLELIENKIKDTDDDQLFYQKKYLDKKKELNAVLDYECYIFTCLAGAEREIGYLSNRQFVNGYTNSCPSILHGNGGDKSKQKYKQICDEYLSFNQILPSTTSISVVAPEILQCNFLSKDDCNQIIRQANYFDNWKSMPGDKFPGQEVRIRDFSHVIFNIIKDYLKSRIYSAIEEYWKPLLMYGIRDMFVIKYSEGEQTSLPLHHDASLVSFSIKLNEDYEGGELIFPRQNFSNINVNVGDAIIWPGQVTHGHRCNTLTKGTKYSLTIWTSRYPKDKNY